MSEVSQNEMDVITGITEKVMEAVQTTNDVNAQILSLAGSLSMIMDANNIFGINGINIGNKILVLYTVPEGTMNIGSQQPGE